MPRIAEIGATRDSYVYRLRMPAPLKAQWDEYCEKKDKKSAATLRALIRYMIQDDMPQEVRHWIAEQTEGAPDSGPKERVVVRLTPTEYQAVTVRATAEGCSPQRWIINCVRASLTHEPQFTMETTKALWESSYQLRAIGRNLNQIAKRLNEGKPGTVKTEQLEKLAAFIYSHTDRVAATLDASLGRWGIELKEGGN